MTSLRLGVLVGAMGGDHDRAAPMKLSWNRRLVLPVAKKGTAVCAIACILLTALDYFTVFLKQREAAIWRHHLSHLIGKDISEEEMASISNHPSMTSAYRWSAGVDPATFRVIGDSLPEWSVGGSELYVKGSRSGKLVSVVDLTFPYSPPLAFYGALIFSLMGSCFLLFERTKVSGSGDAEAKDEDLGRGGRGETVRDGGEGSCGGVAAPGAATATILETLNRTSL